MAISARRQPINTRVVAATWDIRRCRISCSRGLHRYLYDDIFGLSALARIDVLQNAVESAHSLCPGPRIEAQDLPARIQSGGSSHSHAAPDDFDEAKRAFERTYLEGLMQRAGGNVSQASGMHRSTLQRLLRRNGLTSDAFRTS